MKVNVLIPKMVGTVGLVSLALIVSVSGQNRAQLRQDPSQETKQGAPKRPANLNEAQLTRLILSKLDLSQEQVQRIRQITRENQPIIQSANQEAQRRRKALDDAIYGEVFDQAVFNQRVSDLVTAQAAALKARYQNEAAIRQVLTPEQLRQFRNMRDVGQAIQNGRTNPGESNNTPSGPGQASRQ